MARKVGAVFGAAVVVFAFALIIYGAYRIGFAIGQPEPLPRVVSSGVGAFEPATEKVAGPPKKFYLEEHQGGVSFGIVDFSTNKKTNQKTN